VSSIRGRSCKRKRLKVGLDFRYAKSECGGEYRDEGKLGVDYQAGCIWGEDGSPMFAEDRNFGERHLRRMRRSTLAQQATRRMRLITRAPGDSRSADACDRSADTLTGTVTDETSAIVADAIVKVTDPAKQLERQVTTNSDGHFILPQLPPSRYKWMTLTFEVR
jgi:Carboxypeptidase regulatory-like domain